jgi:hypothetical protein
MRNEYKILVVKPEGKKPVGRPRRGYLEYEDVMLIQVAEDRDQYRVLGSI